MRGRLLDAKGGVIRCVEVSFGAHSGSVRGSVRSPFGVVRDLFGIRSGSVRDLFGVRSGSIQAPFEVRLRSEWKNLRSTCSKNLLRTAMTFFKMFTILTTRVFVVFTAAVTLFTIINQGMASLHYTCKDNRVSIYLSPPAAYPQPRPQPRPH